MKTGFIGAGKVGFSLGKLFLEKGLCVSGYFSNKPEDSEDAASFTNSKSYENIEALAGASDIIFLTVPDGQISAVFNRLKEFELKGKIICHTSGAVSACEAFCGAELTGALTASVHPLYPVSDKYESYKGLSDAYFCLEGCEAALSVIRPMLEGMGLKVQEIPPDLKARYHASCAESSNLVCALINMSIEGLVSCGFSREGALKAIAPLAESNLKNVLDKGPEAALTGPVERNDTQTVEKHLEVIEGAAERGAYVALTQELAKMAGHRHPERDYSRMEEILRSAQNDGGELKMTGKYPARNNEEISDPQ